MERPQDSDATLSWELRGPGVEPSRFDVVSTLGAATAYVELLQGVAQLRQEQLRFTGMRIERGSVALVFQVDEPEVARAATRDAHEYLDGRRIPPRGLRTRIDEVHRALGRLPVDQSVHVSVGELEVEVPRRSKEQLIPRRELLALRVVVIRVGGHPPRVAVLHDVEGALTLALSQEQAEAIAHWLYREVDVSAEIGRDAAGKIVEGTVREFFELADAAGVAEADVWRQWFRVAGAGGDDIEDIESELDRSRRVGSP